ncbi:MAG: hypothetical protein PHF31_05700 [Methylobacter sp.]|nr:hypothetical protein [Methylobacter sp.]
MRTTPHTFLLVLAALFITSFNVSASECAPEVKTLLTTNATYEKLDSILKSDKTNIKDLLQAVKDQTTYTDLYDYAMKVATSIKSGRLVITLPDGTVVVDTGKPLDADNLKPLIQANSYQHFMDKMVNENHNSRIAILDSQLHVCGVGVETKVSTTDNTKEVYVARRLGAYLNNLGTARLSVKQ